MAPTDAAEQIRFHLDEAMKRYLTPGLPPDERMNVDGEMRGLSVALAILQGTSGMDETLSAELRVQLKRKGDNESG